MTRRYGYELIVLALALGLGACSGSPQKDYRAIYSQAEEKQTKALEVPPELGRPQGGEQMQIPSIGRDQARYSSGQQGSAAATDRVVATAREARFVREGDMHWLEVALPPERIWEAGREFFQSLGFEITREDRQLGVMETNWQERRERIPGNWLMRMIDSISSTGYQDRYRLRLERLPEKGTRVFISHRGLEEIVTSGDGIDVVETAWVPREPDPELETELLQRFLISLGSPAGQAEEIVDDSEPVKRTRFVQQQDEQILQVNETFARTWRRVGLALDRVGLRVEDRNRSEGTYFIRLTEEFKAKEEKGFWASLLDGEEQDTAVDELLLRVQQQGEVTNIRLRDREGGQVEPALAKRLLEDIEVHLR
ncbi:outer membrane protein assembly factor BamC [Thiohalophilus sp.]|uniref:outer membrane protein assembly factor BamC n=1 Tax=Thiohalophilus sp. TaxID=3028392 RepID=UPI00397703E2